MGLKRAVPFLSRFAYLRRACELEGPPMLGRGMQTKVSACSASAWYPPVWRTQTHGPAGEGVSGHFAWMLAKGRCEGKAARGGDWLRAGEGAVMAETESRARPPLLGRREASAQRQAPQAPSPSPWPSAPRPRVSRGTAARRCARLAPACAPVVEGAVPNRASGDMGQAAKYAACAGTTDGRDDTRRLPGCSAHCNCHCACSRRAASGRLPID
jgi:hypothetical protein